MIYIIHGENLAASRTQILNLQKKVGADSKREISINEIAPEQLSDLCGAFDIFGKPPFIILDISDAGKTNLDGYIQRLSKISQKVVLIILSSKELSKSNAFIKFSQTTQVAVILSQKIPTSNIFKFIDAIFNQEKGGAYNELKNLISDNEDAFYLFTMILYGLRNVAFVKFNSPNINKMAPFTKSKSMSQAKKFTEDQILNLFKEMYKLDKNVKTGLVQPGVLNFLAIEKISQTLNT